ncbi:hypothetical protein [Antarctobacter heliothermus]|uniref:hypothetical protein n=1 Tax=Antarctobacter heliothermus TaxID=74033 RepID=UPI00113042A6|nr:hypothetical protein [Antarctobacter heliothermus]
MAGGSFGAVCLNSPGGSLIEATKIAEFIESRYLGTVIEDGDSCLSACSLIFMLGTKKLGSVGSDEWSRRLEMGLSRRMHVNGTLGFHRPAPTLDTSRSYSAKDMSAAFDVAVNAALEFMRLANSYKPSDGTGAMKPDLIEKLLQHKGQDFYYIDTVDKAGRWDIEIFGYPEPRHAGAREALNACDNTSNWFKGLAPVPVIDANQAMLDSLVYKRARDLQPENEDGIYYFYEVQGRDDVSDLGAGPGERICEIGIYYNEEYVSDKLSVMGCGGDTVFGPSFGQRCNDGDDAGIYLEVSPLSIFSSETRLRDLPDKVAEIDRVSPEFEMGQSRRTIASCYPKEGRFVRVSEGPRLEIVDSTDKPRKRIALAQEWLSLTIGPEETRFTGPDNNRKVCKDWCDLHDGKFSSPEADRAPEMVQTCKDMSLVWWSVVLPDGRSGWTPAQYLMP